MLYQFMDWRIGLHRRMCMVNVERCFERLREANGGELPYCLTRWEQVQIFAGECAINLPEHQGVAESMYATDAYPTVQWVRDEYEKMLKWMAESKDYAPLLKDPPKTAPVFTIPPQSPPPQGGTFDKIVEGSVSNTQVKPCSEPDPKTSSHTLTSTVLPNSSLTEKSKPPQRQRHN